MIRLDPARPAVYHQRGLAYLAMGRPDLAKDDFTEALRLDPRHAAARAGRGEALAGLGDFDQAVIEHLDAIRQAPKSAAAYDAFARLWLTWPDELMRNPKVALDLAQQACELSGWGDPACLATLASAQAALAQSESP